MIDTTDMPLIDAVLAQVNEIREIIGSEEIAEIPKGICGSRSDCPIARALSNGFTASVSPSMVFFRTQSLSFTLLRRKKIIRALNNAGYQTWEYPTGSSSSVVIPVNLTEEMKEFVLRFDERQLPLLIEE